MSSDQPQSALTRRSFLKGGIAPALLLGGSSASLLQPAEGAGRNPFAYRIDRFRVVDPKLIHYRQVQKFKAPDPAPRRIAINQRGEVYLAAGQHVFVLEADGAVQRQIDTEEPVRCVDVAEDGTVYVGHRSQVMVHDAQGKRLATWESLGDQAFITGLAVGKNEVYVADAGNRIVHRFDRSGKAQGQIAGKDKDRGIPGLIVPSPYLDVVLGADGLLRVNNPGRHRVELYDTRHGSLELSWGRASAAIDGFCGCCNPIGLALLPDGRCVTFEKGIPRVKIYSIHGEFESVVADPDSFADVGKEYPSLDPDGLGGVDGDVDPGGRIWIVDSVNANIHIRERKSPSAAIYRASNNTGRS